MAFDGRNFSQVDHNHSSYLKTREPHDQCFGGKVCVGLLRDIGSIENLCCKFFCFSKCS